MDTDELLIVLLTGGGLALIGTILGALITQVFTIRIGREARREERRLAVKTFQRDTLVALQDDLVEAMNLFEAARLLRRDPGSNSHRRGSTTRGLHAASRCTPPASETMTFARTFRNG